MGRKKANPPEDFPWDKFLSENEKGIDVAMNICIEPEGNTSADTIKRAATTIGIGYNSGDKVSLCNRIKIKVLEYRTRLEKIRDIDEQRSIRNNLITYFKRTLMKKYDASVAIPAMPILPPLSPEEKLKYKSPPSSPRAKKRIEFEEDDDEDEIIIPKLTLPPSVVSAIELNDQAILTAESILYYKNAPVVDGKLKISLKQFAEYLKNKYKLRVLADSMLLKDEDIKRSLSEVISKVKANSNKLEPNSVSRATSVINEMNKSEKYKQRAPVIEIEEDEEEEKYPIKEIPKVYIEPSFTKEEILNYIRSKGWNEPTSKTKEGLCDFVLTNLTKEDVVNKSVVQDLNKKIDELTNKLLSMMDMQQDRIKKLEESKKKKVAKKKVIEIEDEVEQVSEKIEETKSKLQDVKEQKKVIEEEIIQKKNVCFKLKEWLDRDDLTEEERQSAIEDLKCEEGSLCNIDKSECDTSISSSDYSLDIDGITIKSKDRQIIDKVSSKLKKKEKEIKQDIEESKEKINEIIESVSQAETKEEIDEVTEQLEQMKINQEDVISKVEEMVEDEESIEEVRSLLDDMTGEIEKDSEIIKEVNMKLEEIVKEVETKKNKKCFEIDEDETDETKIAQSLMCGEGEVCNVEIGECIPEKDADYVEELTLGGMIVKLTGKNKIIDALKQKIIRMKEIPVQEEPKEKETIEEVIKEIDTFEEEEEKGPFISRIPSERPTLEQIIKGIKTIAGTKPTTNSQNRIRIAEMKAIEKIRMCVGI